MRAALRSPLVVVGASIVALMVVVAVLAPLLAPFDPEALAGRSLEPPSARHLLGTDDLGHDILSQLIWGARTSLVVAVGAASLVVVIGVAVGVGSALVGGVADVVAMRLIDIVLAIPTLPLLILIAALAGPGPTTIVLALGLIAWPPTARILRSQTLTLRQRGFVDAARGFGGGAFYVVRRHLVPALGPILVTRFVLMGGIAVVAEAGLAFLGLSDPIGTSWGLMLNRALARSSVLFFTNAWTWSVLPAGLAITLAVLGFSFLGVGLEPLFNPRSGRLGGAGGRRSRRRRQRGEEPPDGGSHRRRSFQGAEVAHP